MKGLILLMIVVGGVYGQQLFITKDVYYETDGNDTIEITTNLWSQKFKWKLWDSTATRGPSDDYSTPRKRGKANIGTSNSWFSWGSGTESLKIPFNLHTDNIFEPTEYVVLKLYKFNPTNGYDTLSFVISIINTTPAIVIISDTITVMESSNTTYTPILQ